MQRDTQAVDISNYKMKYQKRGTVVALGNVAIPHNLITEYVGTICFQSETAEGVQEFTDISLTREQFEGLKQAIEDYLNISCRLFPPAEQRYFSPFPNQDKL